jgi:16S rRNA G966 N2-methylase RsmD
MSGRAVFSLTVAGLLAVAAAAPVRASQEDLDMLERECAVQLDLSAGDCGCVAEAASRELNDMQQAFVVAMVTRDNARYADLRQRMTVEEMTDAAGFVTRAPGACSG